MIAVARVSIVDRVWGDCDRLRCSVSVFYSRARPEIVLRPIDRRRGEVVIDVSERASAMFPNEARDRDEPGITDVAASIFSGPDG